MNNIYIFGSNGQDGKLAFELLNKRSRKDSFFLFNKDNVIIRNQKGIEEEIKYNSNFEYINIVSEILIKYNPSVIFYFAAIHFSYEERILNNDKSEQLFTNHFLPVHILNECALLSIKPKFLYTSSSLIFSGSKIYPQDEMTERYPTCDYSKQKVLSEKFLTNLGSKLGIEVFIAILYNHESIFRKNKFFTKKVISFFSTHKRQKSKDKNNKITLFNKEALIDMGYAKDFVEGMIMLIKNGKPGAYIFSTNNPIKVITFVKAALGYYQLSLDLIVFKESPSRSKKPLIGENKKIFQEIRWQPIFYGENLARKLCDDFEESLRTKKLF